MESKENVFAVDYVIKRIHSLLPNENVELLFDHYLVYHFYIPSHKLEITFDRDIMENLHAFQSNLKLYEHLDEYLGIKNFVNFRIYIVLGKGGLIPQFSVSNELLNEKRDWLENYEVKFEKPDWLYAVFFSGLKKLSSFLTGLVDKYKLPIDGIDNEQEDIKALIDFYEKEHNFTDKGVSASSLGYFKAAAVCVILDKEMDKKSIIVPRILKARDGEIYSIVSEMRENPFPQIKMPDCIYDYSSHIKNIAQNGNAKPITVSNILCGPLAKDMCDLKASIKEDFSGNNIFLDIPYSNYEDCENALRDLLGYFDLQPIIAKDKLTSNAVLCKVCQLIKTCKYGIADISSSSNSVSYEYGLMHGFGMKVCLLLRFESEKFTDIYGLEHLSYDGLRKFKITIAKWILDNVVEISKNKIKVFIKSEEDALSSQGEIPLNKIRSVTETLPELDIILNREPHHLGSMSGGERGYFEIRYGLSFRIRNKSNVTICLEDVRVENVLLGTGKLDKTNPRLSKIPFNVESHRTEEVNLLLKFPNEVNLNMKDKDLTLKIEFEFADRVITKELTAYL